MTDPGVQAELSRAPSDAALVRVALGFAAVLEPDEPIVRVKVPLWATSHTSTRAGPLVLVPVVKPTPNLPVPWVGAGGQHQLAVCAQIGRLDGAAVGQPLHGSLRRRGAHPPARERSAPSAWRTAVTARSSLAKRTRTRVPLPPLSPLLPRYVSFTLEAAPGGGTRPPGQPEPVEHELAGLQARTKASTVPSMLAFDVAARRLDVDADLEARRCEQPPAPRSARYTRGVMAKCASLVSSASEDAVTRAGRGPDGGDPR